MKIYKYEIEIKKIFSIILPEQSKILTIQLQNNVPMIWAAVTDHSTISYDFAMYGTGEKMDNNLYHKYISTIQEYGFVWHFFQIVSINNIDFFEKENLNKLGYF